MSHNDHVALSDYLFSTMILENIRRFICFPFETRVAGSEVIAGDAHNN